MTEQTWKEKNHFPHLGMSGWRKSILGKIVIQRIPPVKILAKTKNLIPLLEAGNFQCLPRSDALFLKVRLPNRPTPMVSLFVKEVPKLVRSDSRANPYLLC
jgi:hypothetical protein